MKNKKKTFKMLLACALTFVFGLSACGTSNEDTLIVGLECNCPPFNWTENSENENTLPIANKFGQYADGYDIEISKIISKELNKKVVIMKTVWESLIPDLQMGTIDVVIANMTDTPERRESIDFTNEYYRSEVVLIVKKEIADLYNNQSLTPDQMSALLKGKLVISQASTVTDDIIDIFATEFGAIHANPADSEPNAASDVSAGSVFAMTIQLPIAKSIVSAKKDLGIIRIDQSILGEAQSALGASIGLRKGRDDLKQSLNDVLKGISQEQRDSLMDECVQRSEKF